MESKSKIYIILGIVSSIALMVFIYGFLQIPNIISKINESDLPNIEVTINEVCYSPVRYGDGYRLHIDMSLKNYENRTIDGFGYSYFITDTGRKLGVEGQYVEILPNTTANVTLSTWDEDFACDSLKQGEKPVTFALQCSYSERIFKSYWLRYLEINC